VTQERMTLDLCFVTSVTLQQLESDGLVSRGVVGEPRVQLEYCLTAFGGTR
jgi:DNA-binding HxlR family transcriptional regulator